MDNEKEKKKPGFLLKMIYGGLIGLALIVPGFSGGTVAVIVGIYDDLLGAISGLLKRFKESFMYLLPILLGALIAILALVFPIKLGFQYIPLGMTCLFAGMMLGGCGPILKKLKSGFKPYRIIPFVLACAFAIGICFIPVMDILGGELLSFGPIVFILIVGILAASGFIVPGISGSMIALIFGVYPLVVNDLSTFLSFSATPESAVTFIVFFVGAIVGMFLVSFVMKTLLRVAELGTYYAIAGFIAGSVFSIFYTQDTLIAGYLPIPLDIILACVLGIAGFALSVWITVAAGRKTAASESN